MKYQLRHGGAITEYNTLPTALSRPFDKISWTEGDVRVILWADGEWEVRTEKGHFTGQKFTPWLEGV